MNLISGGIIVNSNYIGTTLNGLVLNLTPKELSPFMFLQKRFYIDKSDRMAHFISHSKLKELDINDFYKIKQTNEEMKYEQTKNGFKT